MSTYRVTAEEVHKVEYEVDAESADKAEELLEGDDWSNVYCVNEEVVERTVEAIEALKEGSDENDGLDTE